MTLHVELESFAAETKRHTGGQLAYISRFENKTHVTSASPASKTIVSASTKLSLEETKLMLMDQGLEVVHGTWQEGGSASGDSLGQLPYIAAIAYKSGEEMPGIWVDVFADPPSPAIALKSIYDEFRETGEVGDISFEEFVRLANPNIAILNPGDIERFLNQKSDCP